MVRFRGMQTERLGDAPFVGALILATDCSHNCPGCFNQHLKDYTLYDHSAETVISLVKLNPLHQGIILGGLEWTEQPEDLRNLVIEALNRKLQVMLYTHLTLEQFLNKFEDLAKLPIWCKFGEYREGQIAVTDLSGIKLASPNQYVMFMGGESLG